MQDVLEMSRSRTFWRSTVDTYLPGPGSLQKFSAKTVRVPCPNVNHVFLVHPVNLAFSLARITPEVEVVRRSDKQCNGVRY